MSVRAATPRLLFGVGEVALEVVRYTGVASSVLAVSSDDGPVVLVPDANTARRVLRQLGLSSQEARYLVETAVLVE